MINLAHRNREYSRSYKNLARATRGALTAALLILSVISGLAYGRSGNSVKIVTFSGFLGDYSNLRPTSRNPQVLRFKSAPRPLASYKMLLVDPILVFPAPGERLSDEGVREAIAIASFIERELAIGLGGVPEFELVKKSGTGVARIRLALTNIKMADPEDRIELQQSELLARQFGMKLTPRSLKVSDFSVEAEVLDSESGDRLAALIDTEIGSKLIKLAGRSRAPALEPLLRALLVDLAGPEVLRQGKRGVVKTPTIAKGSAP